jgi:hypothetical protein
MTAKSYLTAQKYFTFLRSSASAATVDACFDRGTERSSPSQSCDLTEDSCGKFLYIPPTLRLQHPYFPSLLSSEK